MEKTRQEIETVLARVDEHAPSRYPGMTYEQGVSEALQWALGNIADEEFEYAMDEI